MARYVFGCKGCGSIIEVERPMVKGPPEQNPICSRCQTRTTRVYMPVPVKFMCDGFSRSGRFDRPDERLKKEIAHSQDFDAVTGKSWEDTDKELEQKKARFGEAMRKDFVLPQKE